MKIKRNLNRPCTPHLKDYFFFCPLNSRNIVTSLHDKIALTSNYVQFRFLVPQGFSGEIIFFFVIIHFFVFARETLQTADFLNIVFIHSTTADQHNRTAAWRNSKLGE